MEMVSVGCHNTYRSLDKVNKVSYVLSQYLFVVIFRSNKVDRALKLEQQNLATFKFLNDTNGVYHSIKKQLLIE